VATGLAAFQDEVDLHLDGRCSAVGSRHLVDAHALPVPAVRLPALDRDGRDFA
jgi:hypothetical protein